MASARAQSIAAPEAALPVNRWIIGEVVETLARLDKAFAELRFDDMADAIYHFTWGTFCDWYVELVKGAFDDETRAVAAWAFDQILVMLHPFMPFVTEELWHSMGERPYDLIVAKWPEPEAQRDPKAAREIGGLVEVIDSGPRDARRAQHPVERRAGAARHRRRRGDAGPAGRQCADRWRAWPRSTAPVTADAVPPGSAQIVVGGVTIAFPLEGAIDLDAERPACPRPSPPRKRTRQPRRAPRQPGLRRARQARGGREGPRRP